MKRSRAVNVVAVVVIAAAALRLYLFFNPSPPAVDSRPHRALGSVLAAEAARLLDAGGGGGGGGGGRLFVIAREGTEFKVPAAEAQLGGFLESIRKSGKKVAAVRQLKVDPLRAMAVPPGDFFDLLRQAAEEDVIVSFLGPPSLTDAQVAKLGAKRPRVLAVCPGRTPARVDLRRIFDQKLLTTAVVSRPDAPAAASPGNAQSAFDQMFKVINADNLAELQPLAVTGRKEGGP